VLIEPLGLLGMILADWALQQTHPTKQTGNDWGFHSVSFVKTIKIYLICEIILN
jgi:hypothetical protein